MYNFDELANRKNTYSLKWDVKENELPMWVADMDFKVAPFIKSAIKRRMDIEAYGYSLIPEDFFASIIGWYKRRHNIEFKREWMIYSSGVVAAISSMVRRLTNVGDNVIVQAPTYNIFYNSIINNKRAVLSNDLKYENGVFAVDFIDLEKKMSDKKTTLMILCNPHNPIGKIWSKDELEKIGKLAKKYNVTVISDEIHCDLTDPGYEYVPFASVNDINKEISITCIAASKTFNIAGLQSACLIIPNESLRKNVDRGLNNDEVAEPNFFSMEANIAAFTNGDIWVDELKEYIHANKQYFYKFVKENLPNLHAIEDHATYLVFVDISYYSNDSIEFCKSLREKTGLYVSDGEEYGKNSKSFFRINLATSRINVEDGCQRLKKYIDSL
ncbi:MAG: pyridoxal phosphate-dependent aminotransferase [Erysipelotrichales bacterium]|nr:pyridoxal phosphate-dependent aminotransferase [Erysipelotrichales bacterium]